MFCENCGVQLNDGVSFCPHCGQAVRITNMNHQNTETNNTILSLSNKNIKNTIARKMAARYCISGILLSIIAAIYYFFAVIMFITSDIYYAIAHLISGTIMLIWSITRFIGQYKIKKNNSYSATKITISSSILCVLLVRSFIRSIIQFVQDIDLSTGFDMGLIIVIFLYLYILCIIVYEIFGIGLFLSRNKTLFPFEKTRKAEEQLHNYVEQPGKWDIILKNEQLMPIDESHYLYSTYMDYRKDKLEAILDTPQDYREEAVHIARYVFIKRYITKEVNSQRKE